MNRVDPPKFQPCKCNGAMCFDCLERNRRRWANTGYVDGERLICLCWDCRWERAGVARPKAPDDFALIV